MTPAELLSLADLVHRAGCRARTIERLFQYGVIEEVGRSRDGPLFEPAVVARVQRALRLRQDLRVGFTSLGLVLDLLDRIDRLEEDLDGRR